jgi:hypothetical protein
MVNRCSPIIRAWSIIRANGFFLVSAAAGATAATAAGTTAATAAGAATAACLGLWEKTARSTGPFVSGEFPGKVGLRSHSTFTRRNLAPLISVDALLRFCCLAGRPFVLDRGRAPLFLLCVL